jgi:RNA polymerase sigma-70 factor, ECF subfamily
VGSSYTAVGESDRGMSREATVLATEALNHVDALYAFACRLSRSPSLAEDLVQDTFARCLSASEQFQPGTNLKAWLFRILRNLFIDQQRRAVYPVRVTAAEVQASSRHELLRGDAELDQLRRLVAEDIEAALVALTEDQRSVVLLDVEGFSETEIAHVLSCAPGTVKSRLARARAQLRELLWEYAR